MLPDEEISIHAPRTGSDARTAPGRNSRIISIHAPRTGSDVMKLIAAEWAENFNPRSPHGERLQQIANLTGIVQFQSTLPARGATTALRAAWMTSA